MQIITRQVLAVTEAVLAPAVPVDARALAGGRGLEVLEAVRDSEVGTGGPDPTGGREVDSADRRLFQTGSRYVITLYS